MCQELREDTSEMVFVWGMKSAALAEDLKVGCWNHLRLVSTPEWWLKLAVSKASVLLHLHFPCGLSMWTRLGLFTEWWWGSKGK